MNDKNFNNFDIDPEKQVSDFANAKPSWFKAHKGFIWVSAGLLVGAGIGTGVGFLVLDLHNKNDGTPLSQILNQIQSDKDIPFTITERDSKDPEYQSIFSPSAIDISEVRNENNAFYTNSQLGLQVLKNKIKNRLGFGPEAAILKSIEITGDGTWNDANGVYFGATNQIFIKSQNIIKGVKKFKTTHPFANSQQIIEYAAEYVFQVISHEYNHHLAEVYLNSRFNDTTFFKANPEKVRDKQSDVNENWDSDFYKTFVSALNYDGKKAEISKGQVPDYKATDGITYKSLANYYSAKELFDLGNSQTVNTLPGFSGTYSMFGQDRRPYQVFKTLDNLKYYYSLSELFARKMMQATMPTQPGFPADYLLKKVIGDREDNIYGADQFITGEYSPLRVDLMMYANGFNSQAYFSDYIYNGNDNSNANKIFDALISEMGYKGSNVHVTNGSSNEQADISAIWWENNSTINPNDGTTILPQETNSFNMGGYINNSNLNAIGYLDANGKFIKLANIKTNAFDLGVKSTIYSDSRTMPVGDKYYWNLDGYHNIKNFVGKDLVFATERTDAQISEIRRVANATITQKRTSEGKRLPLTIPRTTNVVTTREMPADVVIEKYVDITSLVSFNSESTTWLSKTSAGDGKTGINKNIARPVENTNKTGVTLEVKKY